MKLTIKAALITSLLLSTVNMTFAQGKYITVNSQYTPPMTFGNMMQVAQIAKATSDRANIEFMECYDNAIYDASNNNYARAILNIKQCISINTQYSERIYHSHGELLSLAGQFYLFVNNYVEAKKYLSFAAMWHFKKHDFTNTIDIANRFIDNFPYNGTIMAYRGISYFCTGSYDSAITDLILLDKNKGCNNKEIMSFANTVLADYYFDKAEYFDALRCINYVISTNRDADNLYTRAKIYYKLERYDKCIVDATDAIKIDRKANKMLGKLYFIRGYAYEQMRENKKSEKDLRKATDYVLDNVF